MKCGVCGEDYQRDSGPMITVCTPCLNRPRPPEAFVQVGKLYLPNPEAQPSESKR